MPRQLRTNILAISLSLFLATLAVAALGLPGCVGYGTYPRSAGPIYPSAVNSAAGEEIMLAAIEWTRQTVARETDGLTPDVTINFPVDISPQRALRIVAQAGPGVETITPGAEPQPGALYHIGRIAVRGDEAEIDVYRPVFEVIGTDGSSSEPTYQCITLYARGGLEPWHIERSRPWTPGAFFPPEINIIEPTR